MIVKYYSFIVYIFYGINMFSKGVVSGVMATETAISAGTEGLFLPVEFITGGLFGSIMIAKKIKHSVQNKKDNKAAEEQK
jgi:hypothetical protein